MKQINSDAEALGDGGLNSLCLQDVCPRFRRKTAGTLRYEENILTAISLSLTGNRLHKGPKTTWDGQYLMTCNARSLPKVLLSWAYHVPDKSGPHVSGISETPSGSPGSTARRPLEANPEVGGPEEGQEDDPGVRFGWLRLSFRRVGGVQLAPRVAAPQNMFREDHFHGNWREFGLFGPPRK